MAHPIMYDEHDPLLARLREIALALPQAQERVSHGAPNWFTTKSFVGWRAHLKGDPDRERLGRAMWFKPDESEREALLADPRFHVPAYIGPSGWLALDLAHHLGPAGRTTTRPDDPAGVDWAEVRELVETSYRNTAPARLVRQLDGS